MHPCLLLRNVVEQTLLCLLSDKLLEPVWVGNVLAYLRKKVNAKKVIAMPTKLDQRRGILSRLQF